MDKMANSAGAADKEMEIITNSLTYKLNALRETGTGIWQNLLSRESIGGVVSDLTTLLSVVEKFTDKVGLLGTILSVGAFAIGITKAYTFFKQLSGGATLLHSLAMAFPALGNAVKIFNANMAKSTGVMTAFGAGASSLALALAPLLVLLGALAVHKWYKDFDNENSSWTKAQESAEKAVNSYQDAQKQLDDLNNQQKDKLTQVQEIAAKYDIDVQGVEDVDEVIEKINSSDKGITLVDQIELEKISTANQELEAQLRIQEQIAKIQKQSAISETEKAASTEKSYWEEVRGRHGDGFLGAAASAWEYFTTRGQGWASSEGSIEDQYIAQDTTNLGLAKQAYEDLIAKKQELATLDKEIEQTSGDLTQEQIDKRTKLTEEIAEQGRKTATLANTVQGELEYIRQSSSEFAKSYVPDAEKLIRDIANIDASPMEAAYNNIKLFFDGTYGKNAIKEMLEDASRNGENLESVLESIGLSLEDLDVSDATYLEDYFRDITKEVEAAQDAVEDFRVDVKDVEEAGKSTDSDSDWASIQKAYKSAKDLLDEGKTGVDDFQTMAQFLSPDNVKKLAKEAKDAGGYAADAYQKAFEDAKATADRWFADDETQAMKNFVDDMSGKELFTVNKNDEKGLWDIQANFETTAEAAEKFGMSVGSVETMLNALEAYGYDFSNIERSGEMLLEYQQYLEGLQATYDSMTDGEGKERVGELINSFKEQYEGFETDLSKLSEEQIVHIKFEYDLASIQSKIDEIQELINGGDNSVENNAQLIATNNRYIKTAEEGLGLNKDGIQLPVQYVVADNTEASLREQLKDATPEEKVGIQTKIENQQQIKKDILDTFADEHPEITPEANVDEINSALADTFEEKTITFNASVDGVEQAIRAHQNEDGTITYTANVDGVQTEVQQVQNEDGTITYTASVENEPKGEDLKKKGTVEYEAKVNDSGVTKDKSAKVSFSKDSTAADNYKPGDKQAKVIFGKDSSEPDNYHPSDKIAHVNYYANTNNLPTSLPSITRYVNYVKTGDGQVDGTAHAKGTAYSQGTARKGIAFARGNWGTKDSGTALVGELGRELLIRGGTFQTIGDDGAEFVSYKKGDIELCPHTAMCV